HSTAILGALMNFPDSRFAILTNESIEASFKPLNETYRNILPIFGAHPLSNLFNQNPILLVEGDDDVRIWQQVIRTTNGEIKFYPCSVGGVDHMNEHETSVIEIIKGVYDDAKAFSLRDKDDSSENIDDILPLIRFKLSCRAAENLFLTDEVLSSLDTTWDTLQLDIEKWLVSYPEHQYFSTMEAFKKSNYDRKEFDLKDARNILIGLVTSKPWEVAVGQVIGKLVLKQLPLNFNINKLCNYLGNKLTNHLRV
ncbi:MAG: hypothetical protein H0W84_10000, partial [Bacteroidetes bacterium]|nr:hypothetical protein [Bacteroidota bacterium]